MRIRKFRNPIFTKHFVSNSIKSFFVLIIAIGTGTYGFAQGDLPTSQVEVIKGFEARLAESERIQINPGQVVTESVPENFEYEVLDHTEPVAYDPPVIKPKGYKVPAAPTAYKGFLKAGAGWPLNYLAQAGYRWDENKDQQVNLFADIRGLNDGRIDQRKAMNARLKGDYSKFAESGVKINALAGYQNDSYHFYNPPMEVDSLTANKVNYGDVNVGVSIGNYLPNNLGVDYELNVEGKFLSTNYAQKENTFNLEGIISKSFAESWKISALLGSYNDTYLDINKYKQNYFLFNPTVTYSSSRFQIKGGVMILSSGNDANIKPDVEIEVAAIPTLIHAFAGANGGYKINGIRTFILDNPFLSHTMDTLKITNINHYYGGIKGNAKGISYNLQGGFRDLKNLPIFQIEPIIDEPDYLLYAPIFDNAKNIYGELSVSMPLMEHLNIYTLVRYDHYTMDELDKPYYIPAAKVQLGGKYGMLQGRLNFGLDFNFLTAVEYPDNDLEKPNSLFDVNINGEYLFTERFGLFIQFNNLADSRYIRWQNYEGLGLNVLGGISVRF